jgi:hypothetical protein
MSTLERINLNIPVEARSRLRKLARARGVNESETARALLLRALDDVEREEFYRAARAAHENAAHRARHLEILRAFEGLRGPTR